MSEAVKQGILDNLKKGGSFSYIDYEGVKRVTQIGPKFLLMDEEIGRVLVTEDDLFESMEDIAPLEQWWAE